ncbi:protein DETOXIFICATION 21-like [Salvia hispanica]|uniref:protein DETOXIFICATION 21-like n=1 Tax=Salvia hispanica TaxID=49212 RepID=UPI002009C070|nr:protein DETOXIFICATION 21-like [Salvia hispanica]XP_047945260.1 protein DETOXIFICATION 21-like [Salvia hispanica]
MAAEISENLLIRNVEEDGDKKSSLSDRIWIESKKIWIVAAPAMFCRFTTFGTGVISQAFIGHVGSKELAAFALVFTVFVRFAQGILLGMANGLETLCGQAYGAQQYHMLGIYLQRSWIVSIIASTVILPFFILTAPILKALGQEAEIADMAQSMATWMIPVVYSFVLAYTCQMYLQAQSKNMIIAYLAAVSLALHVFLSWLLTMKFEFGVTGAMVSTVVAFWLPNIGQLAFVACGGCPQTWRGFSMLAFKDLWPILKLSLSAGAMLCLEVWYYPVIILLTGNMTNAEVAIDALSICLNINGWELMISLGFMAAASVRISNELGAGNSKAAKFSIATIVITSFSIGLVLFVVFMVYRRRVAYLFTDSEEVAAAVDHMGPLLAFSILLNSVQPALSGVAIGSGWQGTVAWVNLTTYYIIGLPIGIVLLYFLDWGVEGVWIGMMIGVLIQSLVLVWITYRTNWEKQVEAAQGRVNRWLVKDEHN